MPKKIKAKRCRARKKCPECGRKKNYKILGGSSRCFHCKCGYTQCAPAIRALAGWGKHTEKIHQTIKALDRRQAESVALAPSIIVTNATK